MSFSRWQSDIYDNDGKAWDDGTGQYKWYHGNGDEAITIGQFLVFRTKVDIPKGSLIRFATWRTEYIVKNGGTIPQSFTANVFMEFNAAPYGANDTYLGPVGNFPPHPRIRTKAGSTFTLNYTANTPEADFVEIPITAHLQEIVNRPDYEPGMFHSVIINPTAEVGDISIRTRNAIFASEHPAIKADYIEPNAITVTDRYDMNWMQSHSFEENADAWGGHGAYGTFVETPTFAKSTEQFRRGGASLKVGTTATDASKGFMAYTNVTVPANKSFVFCGWVYVPSSNPNPFQAQFLYINGSPSITVKDQWVPFCTPVVNVGTGNQTLWPAVVSNGSANPAYTFYVDDLAVVESKFRQYPWDDGSADHRKLDFKKFYDSGPGAVVRTGPAMMNAKVNPFIVLDDLNDTAAWSVEFGAGVTFDMFNGGVRVNVPSGVPTVNVKYTHTGHFRRKRYLVINSDGLTSTSGEVYKVTTAQGGVFDYPAVQATEPSGSTTRRFYDIPQNAGDVNNIHFVYAGPTGSAWSFVIYDIGESDRTTAQSNGMITSTGWVLKDGMWVRTTTERQSSTFDDTESSSGRPMAGWTGQDLANYLRSWEELENN